MSYLPVDINPLEAKTAFAAALLRHPHEHFKAATLVFPDNMQAALFIMQTWQHDPFVRDEKQRLLDEFGPDYFLPTQFELAHDVYALAGAAAAVEDRIKGFRLYAEIRGFISKAPVVNNNVDNSTKVLMVSPPDPEGVKKRQAQLLRDMAEDAA